MQTYYIFVTGGVVSGIGKGLFAASLGMLIKSHGYDVIMQKCDPYINVDPGLMSPYQHGEVFVTDDGAETDLDLGHYERFLDINLSKASSVTTGSIYSTVIQREREGGYNGKTVQVIPQIVDEIKMRMRCFEITPNVLDMREPSLKQPMEKTPANVRFVIIEIGGTVGDIESTAFLEAMRQVIDDVGKENACSFHVSYVPFIQGSNELKTKPTQHSVRSLLSLGIKPDFIVCRTDIHLSEPILTKLAHSCSVPINHVIENFTVSSVYELPLLIKQVPDLVFKLFDVPLRSAVSEENLNDWRKVIMRLIGPANNKSGERPHIRIGLVGKYVELGDAYLSINEAIRHAAAHANCSVTIVSIVSDTSEKKLVTSSVSVASELSKLDCCGYDTAITEVSADVSTLSTLDSVDAIIVPGGFGSRGVEGKLKAIQYCRKKNKPLLGICLGMQCMLIEFAINVLKLANANSTEFDPDTPDPIIATITSEEVHASNPLAATLIRGTGGGMRLGASNCTLVKGTLAYRCYQCEVIRERHRHRYEFNGKYKAAFEKNNAVFSGFSTEGSLVEIFELPNRDFFIGVQFHPELLSRPLRPHPLFVGLINAALARLKKDG